jgi:hypothetical protein
MTEEFVLSDMPRMSWQFLKHTYNIIRNYEEDKMIIAMIQATLGGCEPRIYQ